MVNTFIFSTLFHMNWLNEKARLSKACELTFAAAIDNYIYLVILSYTPKSISAIHRHAAVEVNNSYLIGEEFKNHIQQCSALPALLSLLEPASCVWYINYSGAILTCIAKCNRTHIPQGIINKISEQINLSNSVMFHRASILWLRWDIVNVIIVFIFRIDFPNSVHRCNHLLQTFT